MLEDYAIKHGFTNLVHFTDDGWSGATFDRPSWNKLVEGVKNGEITACICKDMKKIREKSKEFAEHERIAEENNSDSNVRVEQNAATKSNRQKVKGEKIA